MKVAVCGSGPGAMAVAAHLADAGRATTIVDRPPFASHVAAISA
jgi:phytoene dehydrogenase-like protein